MRNAVAVFADLFSTAAGYPLNISTENGKENVIECYINESLKNDESYKLSIRSSKIVLEGRTAKGIFYGFQTLRQLLPAEIESSTKTVREVEWSIPCADIEDTPRFSYRGLTYHVISNR